MDTGNQPVPISNENVGSEAVLESANIILGEENGGPPELPPVILLFTFPRTNKKMLFNYSNYLRPKIMAHASSYGSFIVPIKCQKQQ